AESGDLLGLACQILHNRPRVDKGEGVAAKRERKSRESLLWVKAVEQIGPAPEGSHWVDVCDRAADTFEFLEYEVNSDRNFVVRSKHSRGLEIEKEGQSHLLHALLRSLEGRLGWEVEVSANKNQPARTARVQCDWVEVTVKSPHVKRGLHG